ncbi:hypothetical protein [Clostridium estertheticum]|uniref:hypothetical protein n=1 Tax=Clostridium estertheticum TaxID=238834 RepID=UPI001C0D6A0E|nr:hypothetical protein [Clostridium estertheticum]MBU3072842.1 hypothetical protein [Clostridium estertheticum]MBU3163121.1 hypothetical protein [Clostridium estertheticum]
MSDSLVIYQKKEIEKATCKKLLSIEEAGGYIGIGVKGVDGLIQNGQIVAKLIDGKKYITSLEIAKWFNGEGKGRNSKAIVPSFVDALQSQKWIEDISEVEFEMIKVSKNGLGSVFYNKDRKKWQAGFYIFECVNKKRRIISADTYEEAMTKIIMMRSRRTAFVNDEEAAH